MTDVDWDPAARDEYLDIWEAAAEAELPLLEATVQRLLRDLMSDPLAVGESRDGPGRVAIQPPLTFWFEVRDGGRRVRIVRVSRPARRE